MRQYTFHCTKCKHDVEVHMSVAGYEPQQLCPACNKLMQRNYQADNVIGRVATRTLGSLADKNKNKLSEDAKADLHRKHNAYRYGPKKKLPEGMSYIDRENPFHDQPRRKKPKKKP